ncbi:hypothetical protein K402DRAFT_270349 [Aulographum hederae CBS 113979]|uniref:Uncharacterized protein n=1 Tax=Aulographum hederae CBS 113979 TaxID=1176131 RepID=A0A6G1H865_9PEZI|nr:hypothetical protein K402DRAFT_270349 [Aulographum hederae CBS 113979]
MHILEEKGQYPITYGKLVGIVSIAADKTRCQVYGDEQINEEIRVEVIESHKRIYVFRWPQLILYFFTSLAYSTSIELFTHWDHRRFQLDEIPQEPISFQFMPFHPDVNLISAMAAMDGSLETVPWRYLLVLPILWLAKRYTVLGAPMTSQGLERSIILGLKQMFALALFVVCGCWWVDALLKCFWSVF